MIGRYKIFKSGELVGVAQNIITDEGRKAFLRYMAGEIPHWAGAIAVGSGNSTPNATQTRLDFEFGRAEVNVRASDLENNSVVVKATLTPLTVGRISEMAVYTSFENSHTDNVDRIITMFNSVLQPFVLTGAAAPDAEFRAGDGSIRFTPTDIASAEYTDILFDLNTYQSTDTFALAYMNNNENATGIGIRMKTDNDNYYSHIITPAAGYTISEWPRSAFDAVGSPNWRQIESIEFTVTSNGTAADVLLDGFRLNDTDPYADYAMVSRAVFENAITKDSAEELDIEYEVELDL